MPDRSGRDASGLLAKLWRGLEGVRRTCRLMWEFYRNCLEANLLVRAWLPRKAPQPRPAAKASFIDRLLIPEKASSAQGAALAVGATVVAMMVTGYWYTVEFRTVAQGRVHITTGSVASTRALSGGTQMSLSAHAMLTVDDTGPQRVAFQEAGEIIYRIRATLTKPFILQTAAATATAVADATLRVAIGLETEFEVLEGAVKVAPKGAKANAPARLLRKGDSWRVPVNDVRLPAFAGRHADRLRPPGSPS
jgi:ferric-dicitrate binding protein FerR (iron transport regulator)